VRSHALADEGPSDAELDTALALKSLPEFIKQGWAVLEGGTPPDWNWHMDAIALHVQAVLEDWMLVRLQTMEKRPEWVFDEQWARAKAGPVASAFRTC
jgi:hypothetical protein